MTTPIKAQRALVPPEYALEFIGKLVDMRPEDAGGIDDTALCLNLRVTRMDPEQPEYTRIDFWWDADVQIQ